MYIEKRLLEKLTKLQIAKELGVSHTTISQEIAHNIDTTFHGLYSHLRASNLSVGRRGSYLKEDRTNGGLLYKNLPHSCKPYRLVKSDTSNVKIINIVGINHKSRC